MKKRIKKEKKKKMKKIRKATTKNELKKSGEKNLNNRKEGEEAEGEGE